MKLIKILPIAFAILSLSCSDSDDTDDVIVAAGTRMTARIDGRDFAALDDATVAGISTSGDITVILIAGAFTELNSDDFATESIGLGLTVIQEATFEASAQWYENTQDGQVIVTGTYFKSESLEDTSNAVETTIESDTPSARIRVTELDRTAGLMSGEFEFIARDERTGETFVITDGRFNQVPFEND